PARAGTEERKPLASKLIDGKAISAEVRSEVAARVAELKGRGVTPGLAAVLVGDDEPSKIYVGAKEKACAEVGIRSERFNLPQETTQDELLALIGRLNEDPAVHGILVQTPLPPQIDVLGIHEAMAVAKDVDGLTPQSVG